MDKGKNSAGFVRFVPVVFIRADEPDTHIEIAFVFFTVFLLADKAAGKHGFDLCNNNVFYI